MIVIRLIGGLGNQLFQYAFAYSLAQKNGAILKVDDTLLNDRSQPHEVVTHRQLELNDVFDIELNYATNADIVHFNGKTYNNPLGKAYNKLLWQFRKHRLVVEKGRAFNPAFLQLKDDLCLVGSFQSEKYFRDIVATIRRLYKFKVDILPQSTELADELKREGSVAIHVRRRDYVTSPVYKETLGALPIDYYKEAVSIVKQRVPDARFYVFSDDIEWCRQELSKLDASFTYVGDEHAGPKAANYLQLMTLCNHFIISNSTYAWWAAWLSAAQGKVVVAPEPWYKKPQYANNDIVPEGWVKVSRIV